MEAEADPFVQRLNLTKDGSMLPPQLPCICYSGEYNGASICLVVNGKDPVYRVDSVGTVPAALATFAILQAFNPDILINAGTAGGFKAQGGAVGDVYLGSAARHHDRHIQMPVYDKYGVYELPCQLAPKLKETLKLKVGIVSSGNSLAASEQDLQHLKENKASVKEMECASVAYVASLFKTPLLPVKAITDIVDGDIATAEEFQENLNKAAMALQSVLPKIVDFIVAKSVAEL